MPKTTKTPSIIEVPVTKPSTIPPSSNTTTLPDTGSHPAPSLTTTSEPVVATSASLELQPVSSHSLPRIAMVSTHGYVATEPPLGAADTGGQVVYVLELSKKLAQLGYAVDIWTRRFENQPPVDIINERVRVIRIPCGGEEFLPKEYLYKHLDEWVDNALAHISEHELKYRFLNSHYWDAGYATQKLSEKLKVPHIHTPHSSGIWKKELMERDFPEDTANFEKKYNFTERIRYETELYHACDSVIATTPPQVALLLAPQGKGDASLKTPPTAKAPSRSPFPSGPVHGYGVPSERVHMIPPGYDDTRFFAVSQSSRDAIRQRLGFEGQVVLALGRLARNKGYDLLIDAFALVAKRVPDAILYLAAGGAQTNTPAEQALLESLSAQAAEQGIAERVRFGDSFIPESDLADYYRAADVFVLSSRYEPFGMTAIEAMACGTPTVVTTHGGLYRALTYGRHALYADTFDKEDLGITITKILRHRRLSSRLSRMGAHKARSLFTWTGIAQQLINISEHRAPLPGTDEDETTNWNEPWHDGD